MPQGNSLDFTLLIAAFPGDAAHRKVATTANVKRRIGAALDRAAEIAVRIVGEEEGRELNRQYRKKDYATNVLTFDYEREPMVMADIVLCGPVVAREAIEQGKKVRDHYAHLTVHGVLHLLGHDHARDADAERLEALERRILASLGIADPYRQTR